MKHFTTIVACHVMAMVLCQAVVAQQADIKTLARQLQSERALDRMQAAQALGQTRDAEAAALLLKCLSDPHIGVRTGAAAALVRIGPPAVRPLIRCLSSANKDLRRVAAHALGDIGDTSAADALTPLLADRDASVKRAAEGALARLNAKSKPKARSDTPPTSRLKPSPPADPDATAEFKSQRGFSFTYPAHWAVATKEQTRSVGTVLKSLAANLRHVDLNRVAVLVYNPAATEFAESLNVVVTRGALPISPEACDKYAATVSEGYRQAGGSVSDVNVSFAAVAGLDALTIRFLASWPHVRPSIRHWQVSIPNKRQTFVVTCSARDGDWLRLEPVFERMLGSLRIEPDTTPSFGTLPGYAKGAIIGGIVGGMIGFLIMAVIKVFQLWRSPRE